MLNNNFKVETSKRLEKLYDRKLELIDKKISASPNNIKLIDEKLDDLEYTIMSLELLQSYSEYIDHLHSYQEQVKSYGHPNGHPNVHPGMNDVPRPIDYSSMNIIVHVHNSIDNMSEFSEGQKRALKELIEKVLNFTLPMDLNF